MRNCVQQSRKPLSCIFKMTNFPKEPIRVGSEKPEDEYDQTKLSRLINCHL